MTPAGPAIQNYGAVFTRRWVVEVLLGLTGYTTDRDLGGLCLLEPACGSGAFLGPAVERLIASAQANGRGLASLGDAVRRMTSRLSTSRPAGRCAVTCWSPRASPGGRLRAGGPLGAAGGLPGLGIEDRPADVVIGNPHHPL